MRHCPPHFERVNFDIKTSEKKIADWIVENLSGRFWMGECYSSASTGGQQKCVAFEEPGEASYFVLVLDQINHYSM